MRVEGAVLSAAIVISIGLVTLALVLTAAGLPVKQTADLLFPWSAKMTAALAWPLAVVIVVACFHQQIAAKFDGLIYGEYKDIKVVFAQQQRTTTVLTGDSANIPIAEATSQKVEVVTMSSGAVTDAASVSLRPVQMGATATVINPEDAVQYEFARNLQQGFLSQLMSVDETRRLAIAARDLAMAQFYVAFEQVNNSIFGSQLNGLRELSARGPVSAADARAFFETARSLHPSFHIHGFAGWFAFLERNQLATLQGDTVTITDVGRAFVSYINTTHPGEIKPW